jgi:hypothetical protein
MNRLALFCAICLTVVFFTGCGAAGGGDCLPGQTTCDGSCVSLQIDPDHCGSCDYSCSSDQVCVIGSCEDLPNLPGQEDIDWASGLVESSAGIADIARTALEMLGLFPTYECEEPRATFVSGTADQFALDHPCVSVSIDSQVESDSIILEFPPEGCEIEGILLGGQAVFSYAGGTDSMELEADLTELQVNGNLLQTTVGYGTCGDEKRYWVTGQGSLPGQAGLTYSLNMTVGLRDGMPVIGGTTLLLDGTAQLHSSEGTDQLTFEDLEYEIGDMLPKEGTIRIETASGRTIQAKFSSSFPIGEVEITIDDYDPLPVPVF